MSQATVNIVYGIICTKEMKTKARELGLITHSPYGLESLGFTVAYHASGENPVWCGMRLDGIWDYNNVLFSKIKHAPSDEQREAAHSKIAALPEALRELASEPDVWYIWSTG